MRRIAIINQKGGVGKTTTAVNLGAALARLGRRVVVIDMDPQANASLNLGAELEPDEPSTYTILTKGGRVADTLRGTSTPGLSILPSHLDLSGAELELASAIGRETILKDALDEWERDEIARVGRAPADVILVDNPPSLGLLSVNGLAASKEVLIAVQTEFFALQGLSKLVEIVQLLRRRMNPELEITGVLACLYDSRLRLAREVLGELRTHFPSVLFKRCIAQNVKLAETPSFGRTIFEYAPESKGADDYLAVAREFLEREGVEEHASGRSIEPPVRATAELAPGNDHQPPTQDGPDEGPEQDPRLNPPLNPRLGLPPIPGAVAAENGAIEPLEGQERRDTPPTSTDEDPTELALALWEESECEVAEAERASCEAEIPPEDAPDAEAPNAEASDAEASDAEASDAEAPQPEAPDAEAAELPTMGELAADPEPIEADDLTRELLETFEGTLSEIQPPTDEDRAEEPLDLADYELTPAPRAASAPGDTPEVQDDDEAEALAEVELVPAVPDRAADEAIDDEGPGTWPLDEAEAGHGAAPASDAAAVEREWALAVLTEPASVPEADAPAEPMPIEDAAPLAEPLPAAHEEPLPEAPVEPVAEPVTAAPRRRTPALSVHPSRGEERAESPRRRGFTSTPIR